jgi:hypothetical protein
MIVVDSDGLIDALRGRPAHVIVAMPGSVRLPMHHPL